MHKGTGKGLLIRSKPFVIGVAGDSGAGKDYVTELISVALGEKRTSVLAGDNYHRWARGDKRWERHTHLDPAANNLSLQYSDIATLAQGKSIVSNWYDHGSGRFVKGNEVSPQRFVLVNGLHSFFLAEQRALFSLRVFVDPEPTLHRYWKTRRDCLERGHSAKAVGKSIERRRADHARYIAPQKRTSDIAIRFSSREPLKLERPLEDLSLEPRLRLEITALSNLFWHEVVEMLRAVPSLSVSHEPFLGVDSRRLALEGTISASTITAIGYATLPNLDEWCDVGKFLPDLDGCLQLLLLTAISHRLFFGRRIETVAEIPKKAVGE